MNFEKYIKPIGIVNLGLLAAFLALAPLVSGSEIFIYRRFNLKENLLDRGKTIIHGELFGQLLAPSNFPSYNDLSGQADRWNFGFHNYFPLSATTILHAQLITHDDNRQRTKFDWHFSLRQRVVRGLGVEIGHDSDHDSDHASTLLGKPYYTNRNYIGLSFPWPGEAFHVEPFLRLFHHTNQRVHLDLSGARLRQELGLRAGAEIGKKAVLSLQLVAQSSRTFGRSEAWLGDLILRLRLTGWLEMSIGGSVWSDLIISPLGTSQTFHKLNWGIAIPF